MRTKKTACLLLCVLLCLLTVSLTGCSRKTDNGLAYEITEDGTAQIVSYTDLTTRPEIVIPDEIEGCKVVKVCDFGVFNADSLTKITIGKYVSEIGSWAFTNNKGLRAFEVNPENEYFTAVDGVLFTKDMKTLVYYPMARNIEFNKFSAALNTTTYVIPDGVETIRTKAFYKCSHLTSVTIPDSVTRIEEKAFHKVFYKTDIKADEPAVLILPASLTYIGKDAFSYCNMVEELVIPAGVTEIGEYAFYNCIELKAITLLSREESMTLGKKWYPTDNGREIKELNISQPE